MIISNDSQGTVLASNGIQATTAFNIARTPHMFRILSSGLYADKVSAVLREIGCNATDAHIMHGTPELPIEVKMPTPLDASLYVKDWGPGLDDAEIRELYTTYGWSNKQKDDNTTGGFGLGSKSPFAYTMQDGETANGFTVETAKNGSLRVYTCFISDSGAPAISRLYEGPSSEDWPHGVKVSFSAQARHINEFHARARDVFSWFTVTPVILGLDRPIEEPGLSFEGKHFALPQVPRHSGAAVMGNVLYPIQRGQLPDIGPAEGMLLLAGATLRLPIGAVMMVPSREGLEYTDKTKAGIKHYLALATADFGQQLLSQVSQNSEGPARSWAREVSRIFKSLPASVQVNFLSLLSGAGATDTLVEAAKVAVNTNGLTAPTWIGTEGRDTRTWLYSAVKSPTRVRVSRFPISKGRVITLATSRPLFLLNDAEVLVVYADKPSADARVRKAIKTGFADVVILITGTDAAQAKAQALRLCSVEGIEGLPCSPSSDLPVPESTAGVRTKRKGVSVAETHGKTLATYHFIMPEGAGTTEIDIPLNDVPAESRYYICQASPYQAYLNDGYGGSYKIDSWIRTSGMAALHVTAQSLDQPITGYLLVKSEARARAMKLGELGFKPLLPELDNRLKCPVQLAKLIAPPRKLPYLSSAKLERDTFAGEFGVLGTLAHWMVQNCRIGDAVLKALEGHEVLAMAGEMLTPTAFDKVPAARSLMSAVTGIMSPVPINPSAHSVNQLMEQKYPLSVLLRFKGASLLSGATAEQIQAVVAMVRMAFERPVSTDSVNRAVAEVSAAELVN